MDIKPLALVAIAAVAFASCSREPEQVSVGLDATYSLPRMKKLLLDPAYTGDTYRWTMTMPSGRDSIVSTSRRYVFVAAEEGDYRLDFSVGGPDGDFSQTTTVSVVHEDTEYSPYTASVFDYRPAPGQFVNKMPLYEGGDNADDMNRKAAADIQADGLVTLGAYGGYITFAFDHTVVNVPGRPDFFVKGNAFYSDRPEYGNAHGGSCEPGIVQVAFDANMNGRPDDDEWYELAGSELHNPDVVRGYSITYRRPSAHEPVKGSDPYISDARYIPWTDNTGASGYIEKNTFHAQDYWPGWLPDTFTFDGTLLPDNTRGTGGQYYVLFSYPWGYVDNHPNDSTALCSFDISNAVDSRGNSVILPGADFIRVYTALNQTCGWLGETSTEVGLATDLHVVRNEGMKNYE